MRMEMIECFAEHERLLRLTHGEIKERLDKIESAVIARNSGDGQAMGNSSNNLGHLDHATPVYTRHVADNQGSSVGMRVTVPSTPPSERLQLIHPDSRGARSDGLLSAGEHADWVALTTPSRHEATPAVSPHNKWTNDELSLVERNPSVDATCVEAFNKLMNDDDLQHSTLAHLGASNIQDDESRSSQYQQMLSPYTKKNDIIHVGATDTLQTQYLTTSLRVTYVNGRPQVVPIPDGAPDEPEKLGINVHAPCKVLVEFKRKRVLQFESKEYVPPGSYVMVGGDRGEDIGLVTYTWCETTMLKKNDISGSGNGSSKPVVLCVGLTGSTLTHNIGLGAGTVLRLVDESDVAQLHTVQVELERRAIDVCSQRVLDRGLPMTIVDAEYQFDKKKLTFFYEAQQRMDFRELVRDLYKSFRARIWMALVEN
ncbi:putative cell cycle sequence binding phosphoprotein (RBP45) [Trypanosoma rangeli]|uniref:Putative cell cycle sequence binding phosphoprotein (RBP45) n=1 Tax=Trypanosoma rangeli TaxID=5698 RepID=A0A3R7KSX6_TRYRA|nr:putative cell cycle sequence binding phosphoprotein (RBP45) [Trypanosoma rangeli]RNF12878.1 putative cell cycle sequence binding phosphoprotein (RBP45) [Trypanosoma rangeli]|eukprot:RNF12878.1 putative cell cycle sequence binding phosphoprotein (RBP45) [Trypanosoma rangeli]